MPPRSRKIAIMGFRSVGKSSLTIQYVDNQFVDSYDPTIENTFSKRIKLNNQEYDLKLIDTAGQDEYSMLPTSYAMNIDGYILVYSVASRKSFDVVKVIYDKVLDMTGKLKAFVTDTIILHRLPLVLVGNKTDLRNERAISQQEGRKMAQEWKCLFLETSAKQNQKVDEIFENIVMETERAEGNIPENKTNSCLIS